MTGQLLKEALHLTDFPYCYIQKVLAIPMLAFVVTFDSRRPLVYLPIARVKKTKVTTLGKIKKFGQSLAIDNYRYTPPILIENSNPIINSSTLIIRRDIGAEYWLNTKMYEEYDKNILNCEVIDYNEKI